MKFAGLWRRFKAAAANSIFARSIFMQMYTLGWIILSVLIISAHFNNSLISTTAGAVIFALSLILIVTSFTSWLFFNAIERIKCWQQYKNDSETKTSIKRRTNFLLNSHPIGTYLSFWLFYFIFIEIYWPSFNGKNILAFTKTQPDFLIILVISTLASIVTYFITNWIISKLKTTPTA